ncbi:MAG: glycerate kinase [Collinsella sp.]
MVLRAVGLAVLLLAIDSFKGSVSSAQASGSCRRRAPRLARCRGARCRWQMVARERSMPSPHAAASSTCDVAGPLGDRVSARMLVDGEHESAVIEMAEAAGIGYSPCTESAALAATTYGVGELMLRCSRVG